MEIEAIMQRVTQKFTQRAKLLNRNLVLSRSRIAISHDRRYAAIFRPILFSARNPFALKRSRDDLNYEICIFDTQSWSLTVRIAFRLSAKTSFGYGAQIGMLFSPDDRQLLIFDHDGYQLFEVPGGQRVAKHQTGLRTAPLRFSACGKYLISGDGPLYVLLAATGELFEHYDEEGLVIDISSSSDNQIFAFLVQSLLDDEASDDAIFEGEKVIIQRWPWQSFVPTQLPLNLNRTTFSLDISHDATRVAACTANSIEIYSCQSLQHQGSIGPLVDIPSVCWAPSGHLIYTVGLQISVVDSRLRLVNQFVMEEEIMQRDGITPAWQTLLQYWNSV